MYESQEDRLDVIEQRLVTFRTVFDALSNIAFMDCLPLVAASYMTPGAARSRRHA